MLDVRNWMLEVRSWEFGIWNYKLEIRNCTKCLIEVVDDVPGIFYSDGKSYEVFRNACCHFVFLADAGVCHGCRVLYKCFNAAK